MFYILAAFLVFWTPPDARAQDRLPLTELSLETMRAFRGPAPNWQVAGAVYSDPALRWSLDAEPGTGVLANRVTEDANDNLFTTWEHGDIELELDFMMPQGSNSGLYLQGRYEVQLLDSWGVQQPTYSDCGGIYERWNDDRPEGRRGFEGHPPRFNASRAPGLWQHLNIIFHAPRFDAAGNKTANARFAKVEHNGVVIHENVEVTGPTRAAGFDDEQPRGPLMIQGDHGPVAFRNIRYKRYIHDRVQVDSLDYRFYVGRFENIPDLAGIVPSSEGRLAGLTGDVGTNPDTFLVTFDGAVQTPSAGRYRFTLALGWITGDPHFQDKHIGGGGLTIGGQTALVHDGRHREASGEITLDAGTHPLTLTYFKNRPWHAPTVALYVEGPDTPLHTLNAPGSLPEPAPIGAILVEPQHEPVVLRSFIEHRGTKRTHTVSVGDPSGLHYSFDVSQSALLHVWKGPFLDATPMWHSRGQDQLSVPQGSLVALSGQPPLAFLDDDTAPWPDSVDHAAPYRFLGYDLDEHGRPVFRYVLGGVSVEDRFDPGQEARLLTRHLALRAEPAPGLLWLRMAAGTTIREIADADTRRLADRTYLIDSPTYYIHVVDAAGAQPVIRTTKDGQELLVPVRFEGGEAALSYSIIW